jgi:hypothetical protein
VIRQSGFQTDSLQQNNIYNDSKTTLPTPTHTTTFQHYALSVKGLLVLESIHLLSLFELANYDFFQQSNKKHLFYLIKSFKGIFQFFSSSILQRDIIFLKQIGKTVSFTFMIISDNYTITSNYN